MRQTDVDVILPCFNPPLGWVQSLLDNMKALVALHPDLSLGCIVVNDGSTRGIDKYDIDLLNKQFPSCKIYSYTENKGKGYAVRYGIEQSRAPYLIYTDIDFPFELSSMQDMLHLLLSGADIVVGHRQKSYENQLHTFRRILSSGSHFFNKVFLNLPYIDTQGGLKCFNAQGKEYMLKTKINRYLFDTEFLLMATQSGKLNIKEMPIEANPNIHFRQMGINTLRKEIFGMIRLVLIKFFG